MPYCPQILPGNDTMTDLETCIAAFKSVHEKQQSKRPKAVSVTNSIFKKNTAGSNGGGVYVEVGCLRCVCVPKCENLLPTDIPVCSPVCLDLRQEAKYGITNKKFICQCLVVASREQKLLEIRPVGLEKETNKVIAMAQLSIFTHPIYSCCLEELLRLRRLIEFPHTPQLHYRIEESSSEEMAHCILQPTRKCLV